MKRTNYTGILDQIMVFNDLYEVIGHGIEITYYDNDELYEFPARQKTVLVNNDGTPMKSGTYNLKSLHNQILVVMNKTVQ